MSYPIGTLAKWCRPPVNGVEKLVFHTGVFIDNKCTFGIDDERLLLNVKDFIGCLVEVLDEDSHPRVNFVSSNRIAFVNEKDLVPIFHAP